VFAAVLLVPAAAFAQSSSPSPGPLRTAEEAAQDQIVLSGSVNVPRGTTAGEVVVFHGRATISGVVYGDVVVLDGPVMVGGLVSGSVVALNGPIRLTADAQVGGDVLGAESVRMEPGATVKGTVRETVGFTLQGPLAALGILLGSVAIGVSTLLLLALLLLIAPRGADRVAGAARTAPFASAGWGILLALALPLVAVAAMVTIVGLPLGLALLLAMSLLFLVGYAWGVFALGRVLVREPRSRWLALLAGWAVAAAVGLVPFLNLAAWSLGGMFGLGAMTVAIWRARAPRKVGRHRAGTIPREPDVMPTPASVTLLDLAAPTEAGPSESEPTAPTATTPATAGGTEPPAEGTSTPATPAYPSSGED
jgi:cytoskeletal protein CcmA (bactofilin family)